MRKILVLNHFPTVFPPTSGGTLRYFHLYHELSNYYDITLLSQTNSYKGGIFRYSHTFREYKVENDLGHSVVNYENTLIKHMESTRFLTRFKDHFEELYKTCDIIIHESPFLVGYDEQLGLDQKLRIYNSHNHEYLLASQIWKKDKSRTYLPVLFECEKKLVNAADLVFATSETEKNSFINMYKKNPQQVKIAPNGIDANVWLPRSEIANKRPQVFFIGSCYPPNIESVEYIIHQLADRCPAMEFMIAGACCHSFSNITKYNVKLLGRIPHKQKLKFFSNVDLAINPMFTGAGVNLKTLEFLSAGLPLISTKFGVRGLPLLDHKHFILAEKEEFADKLNQFCCDKKILQTISLNGQTCINERFSWKAIVQNIRNEIENIG
ncbi:glycosyltransferase family 4 protein [Bacillus sp. NEB1478]|uniref:glycosyltransferase family 4 protein n=1 Tax=Bacillus sp. NEB1478 TaxID=3073816 RepID=UPI002872CB2A|nr:glycosyltransferase family 4 protein [Bacillus sp. NEB1478]WNB91063.1 glycosyltransferase family 4 protein [Bacillus sp. NEB1478]